MKVVNRSQIVILKFSESAQLTSLMMILADGGYERFYRFSC